MVRNKARRLRRFAENLGHKLKPFKIWRFEAAGNSSRAECRLCGQMFFDDGLYDKGRRCPEEDLKEIYNGMEGEN
ncbi:MAG: hypothetical protein M3367_03135 [Acidobacteriota bacterium]|nr:hypothetical protein [Acidobacteriota bacterium]